VTTSSRRSTGGRNLFAVRDDRCQLEQRAISDETTAQIAAHKPSEDSRIRVSDIPGDIRAGASKVRDRDEGRLTRGCQSLAEDVGSHTRLLLLGCSIGTLPCADGKFRPPRPTTH